MNPCPFLVSFLKFAKWQTRRYIPVYELGAANLMIELFTVSRRVSKASSVAAVDGLKVQNQTWHGGGEVSANRGLDGRRCSSLFLPAGT